MIPVRRAKEPPSFDDLVRKKGLAAIAELTGGASPKRRGPPRAKRYTRPEDIPADELPATWTKALPWLRKEYRDTCAYTALYLCPATGADSVDHWIPKSSNWRQAYEWSNFRLCASRFNAKKGTRRGLVDPFAIGEQWFALNLVCAEVIVGPRAPAPKHKAIARTISTDGLDLNRAVLCRIREAHMTDYLSGKFVLDHLRAISPFVAYELERQGLLRPADRPPRSPR